MIYKFRLYPNNDQIQILNEIIEECRLLYNQSLEVRNKYHLSRCDQSKRLKEKQFGIPAQVGQNVLFRLERAFKNYYRDRRIGYPSFKRKGRYNCFTYRHFGFKIKEKKLVLSKIGSINMIIHRISLGMIKTCTIIRDIDRFVCFAVDGIRNKNSTGLTVGIDVGVKNWMTLSTGGIID
jgi:putative transposase